MSQDEDDDSDRRPAGAPLSSSYPLPAYLRFCPGGITYQGATPSDFYRISAYATPKKTSPSSATTSPRVRARRDFSSPPVLPDVLVSAAKQADDRLRQYALLSAAAYHDASSGPLDLETVPHVLPSLSILAEQVFGRLTGCPPAVTKNWADAMVLHYAASPSNTPEPVPQSEDDIYNTKPAATIPLTGSTTAANMLKQLLADTQAAAQSSHTASFAGTCRPTRPCGYVFKRGDIAWNCRTCQADATCVICDDCFRESDHQGHEVYFHRTTPGGCCDCGDLEAWKIQGCCAKHRPEVSDTSLPDHPHLYQPQSDPFDGVRMAEKGLEKGIETLTKEPLPPRLAAALGVVIGAAVQTLVDAVDGAGVGADPVQWKRKWADEAAKIVNGAANLEDYYLVGMQHQQQLSPSDAFVTPAAFLTEPQHPLPDSYQVQLRLHNDDVHTFDEVIEALHGDPQLRRLGEDPSNHNSNINTQPLVMLRDHATEMTHHVDSDGQVTVKAYSVLGAAMRGHQRLKASGLHCSLVSVPQVQMELRARALTLWLSDICAAHPAAAVLVVHALVQVEENHDLGGVQVWPQACMIPPWVGLDQPAAGNEDEGPTHQSNNEILACRRRFHAFPPHLLSSYVTRDEAELMHGIALELNPAAFVELTGTDPNFYAKVPYRLPSPRYRKSPHTLWGCLPSVYSDPVPPASKHPLLQRLLTGHFTAQVAATPCRLTESIYVIDTDLRKQQNPKIITSTLYPHKLPGLHMVSGLGTVRINESFASSRPALPNPMHHRHLLCISTFRAPVSPVLMILLLDPYPTKQVRGALHALFLSLLTDSRFRARFAGALAVAYRPLSTLFCAGVGTEADTILHFTVQFLTAGSTVRALCHKPAAERLLLSDRPQQGDEQQHQQPESTLGVFISPIAHIIVRCVHTNLLGATQEVNMILKNTTSGNDENSADEASQHPGNDKLLPALTYVAGEHPLLTPLPAAPDDGFLDSRSTRHKRLPHLLRDLEYVIETPGTAVRLMLPNRFPVYEGPSLSYRGEDVLSFPSVFARMLRLAQGMDTQKRKISGGHVEYEHNRWLEAFGLSLNLSGARDALAESPAGTITGESDEGSHLVTIREAMGNFVAALLREIKLWLYREGLLETGLPVPTPHGADIAQATSLQRSTLHVSSAQYADSSASLADTNAQASGAGVSMVALSCATGVKMSEAQLTLIENALKVEASMRQSRSEVFGVGAAGVQQHLPPATGALIGDWLRVPHSPLAGDSLSFHLPLHRALAKIVKSLCSVVVPESYRSALKSSWWKLPVLDDYQNNSGSDTSTASLHHPLVPLLRPTLRTANCRVNWSSGPDCTPQEAQKRRSRSRAVSANIAVAKVIHSLADHPMRCLAAAQQVERHLWARNGTSIAGMAMNYSNTPLCRSFRDLDLLLVQLSAAGMSCGLGARRIFSMMLSRFSMDGYLCDPERRVSAAAVSSGAGSNAPFSTNVSTWVNPPRLQDPDHAVILSESFFATICVLVTELPAPPPVSPTDDGPLRQNIRRELLHALVAEPRSHSEAMTAALGGISRREETDGSGGGGGAVLFSEAFATVLNEIGKQKAQSSSRASSGPPAFELKPEVCEEYDPTFFHLKRQEHQHAMDIVARLRKQKLGKIKEALQEAKCLPLVCPPPKAHPRFLPCRLLLHLDMMDAAIRRALLFALTNGSWLPPSEPVHVGDADSNAVLVSSESATAGGLQSLADLGVQPTSLADASMAFSRRVLQAQSSSISSFPRRDIEHTPFSKTVVAASSVSFLEVLQLLTLQIHTLEECASLHRYLPDLDDESRLLSSCLSINSYLGRLIKVPEALADVWAFRPYPHGPLESKGSGANRGSILGSLIALYEHRADHGAILDSDRGEQVDQAHGGARSLASSALKWILRFVHSLVDGAQRVGDATKSATSGIRIRSAAPVMTSPMASDSGSSWTINEDIRKVVLGMLSNLPDLWPMPREKSVSPEKSGTTSKEAGKAAQLRAMEQMKKRMANFAATIKPSDDPSASKTAETGSKDLCIICRCDDVDGENNGPLGYLGHVQRSRVSQIRATSEAQNRKGVQLALAQSYRVVGHMGCQLRETEAMDSEPLTCLPKGSIVTILSGKVSEEHGIVSRRVHVQHTASDTGVVTEGWASIQSSQGYIILTPLLPHCYTNTRWGTTRPVIKQCGHAAHLRCVETHTLSLHHRAASEQTYDGRFAANIDDGEFLCPLCKQLSNILIPRDSSLQAAATAEMDVDEQDTVATPVPSGEHPIRRRLIRACNIVMVSEDANMRYKALEQFGSKLHSAMCVPWERVTGSQRKHQLQWNPAIQKWDYEDILSEDGSSKTLQRLLRQQLIAWSAVGHSAATLEASSRAVEEVLPFGIFSQTYDPWPEFDAGSKDKHQMLLELKRSLTGSAGLLRILLHALADQPTTEGQLNRDSIVGVCLAGILEGKCWINSATGTGAAHSRNDTALWSNLWALLSSLPCHVARDGTIPQQCEARATAAAMWAVKGLGRDTAEVGDVPAPLAVQQMPAGLAITPRWGTLNPFMDYDGAPFRPGIASGFLYLPLLSWDLYTLSAAFFSTILAHPTEFPSSSEILVLARTLLAGRIVQAIITPCGFDEPGKMEMDEEDCWSADETRTQGEALAQLIAHCRTLVKSNPINNSLKLLGNSSGIDTKAVLAGVGRAILPFSRALILMLRACTAAVRERQKKTGKEVQPTEDKEILEALICKKVLMTVEDGFHIVRAMKGPSPLDLVDVSREWWPLVNKWLVATAVLEIHHGSSGRTTLQSETSAPSAVGLVGTLKPPSSDPSDRTGDWVSFANRSQLSVPHSRNRNTNIANEDDFSSAPRRVGVAAMPARDMDSDDDEEMMQDVEMMEAEELVGFAEQLMGVPSFAQVSAQGNADGEDSSDEYSSSDAEGEDSSREFAHVSKSPVLYDQPSLLGVQEAGPGRRGTVLDVRSATAVMSDLSHLGLVHLRSSPTFCLVRLPKSFVELYNIVNRVKGRDESSGVEESEDAGNSETAICLLTGAVMRSGSARRPFSRAARQPGACTIHARKTGSGIGMFFLVQKCTVLLMHNNKSAYSPSLYVDSHGEEDPGLKRGRPLFLNEARYRALELLWRQQGIPREVAQIRSTSDRVIRDSWY